MSRIDEAETEQRVRNAIRNGKRVLWVVNQVSRAQAIAAKLAGLGVPLVCYHSRFKLNDRVDRHRETVEAIKAGKPAAVAVTTQVCEMSLDIDADLLITEECPITSLIQRMGRCRRGRDELAVKGPGEVLVYKPVAEEKVYTRDDIARLEDFLTFLIGKGVVSQTDLEIGVGAIRPEEDSRCSEAQLILGERTIRSRAQMTRSARIEAFNVQAVLASEVVAYLAAKKGRATGLHSAGAEKGKTSSAMAALPSYLFVADDRHYDPQTGFWDTPLR